MNLTLYQLKYYAHELTKQSTSDSTKKLATMFHFLTPNGAGVTSVEFRPPKSAGMFFFMPRLPFRH